MKYWNQFSLAAPRIGSYYFETLLINGLRYHYPAVSTQLRRDMPIAFQKLAEQVLSPCPDPKSLGSNLDFTVGLEIKWKVREAANESAEYSKTALKYEEQGNNTEAIKYWGRVFPGFPSGS